MRNKEIGRLAGALAGAGLAAASLLLFLWFYPVLSGLPVSEFWARSLQVLPSYGFY